MEVIDLDATCLGSKVQRSFSCNSAIFIKARTKPVFSG